nr:YadA-like family protein [Megasphaera sp. An286]
MKTAISDAAYESGKGITVTQKTDDQKGSIAVNAGKGLGFDEQDGNKLMVNTGDGLTVDSSNKVAVKYDDTNLTMTDGALDLKDVISLEKVTATNGFYVDGGPSLTTAGLKIGENTSLTSTGLTTSEGTFSTSVTVGDTNSIQIGNGKISGLVTDSIKNDGDAVSVGYLNKYIDTDAGLAVQYDDASKSSITLKDTTIEGLKATDQLMQNSNFAATVGQVWDVDHKVGNLKWSTTHNLKGVEDLTEAASILDNKIGTGQFGGTNWLVNNVSDLTSAVRTLDTTIGNLTFNDNKLNGSHLTVTAALDVLNDAIGPMKFGPTSFLKNQGNLSGAVEILDRNLNSALSAIGVFTTTDEYGNKIPSTEIDWGGKNHFYYISNGTVVDGMSILDNQIYNINTQLGLSVTGSIDWGTSAHLSGSSIIDGMKNLDTAITRLETRVGDLEKQSGTQSASNTNSAISEGTTAEAAAESAPTETTATETPTAATMESAIAKAPAAANSMLSSAQPMTMALNAPAPANGDPAPVGNPTGGDMSNIHTDGDTTIVEKDFTVEGNSTFNGSATFEKGADMKGNKITNVAAGTEATDGVNYGQLQAVQNQVDANSQNIGILGSAVNKLGDRIERVGAGAAALAALHPLDFDPDNKLDFAAGFGNYRGASAVAVGAFYRPSENVMFSVGGAFGGGEDMVNAGVSFKVGAGSGSATTSRTAMAKSLKSMQEVVASQDAQLAQQREQIDKLTAMVELLMEQNGQAQPKDGDAQAAQPQQ